MVLDALLARALPGGRKAKLSVLIFHRVLPQFDPLFPEEIDSARFDAICGWLARHFHVLPLDQAIKDLASGSLPARAACITFDDGYADNQEVALPILLRHRLSATFFVATGFLDGGRMWNDTIIESIRLSPLDRIELGWIGLGNVALNGAASRRQTVDALIGKIKYLHLAERLDLVARLVEVAKVRPPDNLMMTSHQVRQLRQAGMLVGAHTVNHPILAQLDESQARQEIADGRAALASILGEPVRLFAYPNGKPGEDYLPRCVALVRSMNFDAAVSTQWGVTTPGDDLFQIRRFSPWDRARLRFVARMALNGRRR